jgi:hypothetical protein
MKVKDLIKQLEKHGEKDILFSQDEEGNGFMSDVSIDGIEEKDKTIILYPYNYIEID